ncbi:MAG: tetratricopeptide repeat protein [Terriglobales bacterium]
MRYSSPLVLSSVLSVLLLAGAAHAGDLRITLPKRTKPTPVQKLNQEGVRAIERHRYDEARKLFYKAYLVDPDDPFTLNNLGYISELQGDVDRAQRFYELAAENTTDATIERSTDKDFQGKPLKQVAGRTDDKKMQINRYNVQALGLLMKDRAPEADLVLQRALALDPGNPFTLNNLGYAKEKEGELEQAFTYYSKAANANSKDAIIVTANKNWRGKGISDIASDNAHKVQNLMEKSENAEARVARLNLEGVSAMNRNERTAARKYFQEAYRLAPNNSFTLNNMGFLSEMEGDRETADFYYNKAADSRGRAARVTVSTRREVEGRPIGQVAEFGDNQVAARMELERQARMREGGPILLKTRTGTAVAEPEHAPTPIPTEPIATHDDYRAAEPAAPASNQPAARQPAASRPAASQPAASSQPAAPMAQPRPTPDPSLGPLPGSTEPLPPASNPGNVMQPLPDTQQPSQGQQPATQPPASQPSGGMMQPLPDNQQPPAAQPQQTTRPPQ